MKERGEEISKLNLEGLLDVEDKQRKYGIYSKKKIAIGSLTLY